jgi:hypothetical protein
MGLKYAHSRYLSSPALIFILIVMWCLYGCEKKNINPIQERKLQGNDVKAIILKEIHNNPNFMNRRFLVIGSEVCSSCQSDPLYERILQCQAQARQRIDIIGIGMDSVSIHKNNILYRGLLDFIHLNNLAPRLFEIDSSLTKNLVCGIKIHGINTAITTLDNQLYLYNRYEYKSKDIDSVLLFLSYP